MKSTTQDKREGMIHQVKSEIKEVVGNFSNNTKAVR